MADSRHGGSLEADTADRRQGTRVVFSPIRKSGLTESVYQRLRSEIVAAHLLPGELVTLDELGTRYGVSRTPVREALRRLEAEGLVLFREHRRVQVAPLTVNEIADTYALRILTEGFAVSESVRRGRAEIAGEAEAIYQHMLSDADRRRRRCVLPAPPGLSPGDLRRRRVAGAGQGHRGPAHPDRQAQACPREFPARQPARHRRCPRRHPRGCPGGRPAGRRPAGGRAPLPDSGRADHPGRRGPVDASRRRPQRGARRAGWNARGPAGMSVAEESGTGRVRRQVMAEEVAARIEELINSGKLIVGDKLPPERELARELRISRPTLREGIRALSATGIVRVEHGKGSFITGRPSQARRDMAGGPTRRSPRRHPQPPPGTAVRGGLGAGRGPPRPGRPRRADRPPVGRDRPATVPAPSRNCSVPSVPMTATTASARSSSCCGRGWRHRRRGRLRVGRGARREGPGRRLRRGLRRPATPRRLSRGGQGATRTGRRRVASRRPAGGGPSSRG